MPSTFCPCWTSSGPKIGLLPGCFRFVSRSRREAAVVVHGTAGSGAAMDQGVNLVEYKAAVVEGSVPVGILLNDVVNKDLTRTHLNQHKDEVQKGGKVTVLRKGYVVTNNIQGTPSAGDIAYVHNNGNIMVVANDESLNI